MTPELLLRHLDEATLWPAGCGLPVGEAYERALSVRQLRIARGERPRGYKVGFTNRQISGALFISEHTVQRHLSNIFEKVGVRSRKNLLKRLYFDSWVADDGALRYLLDACGVDRVMLGTDYPFPLGEQVPGEGIERLALDEVQQARIYHGTALEWLGLPLARFA